MDGVPGVTQVRSAASSRLETSLLANVHVSTPLRPATMSRIASIWRTSTASIGIIPTSGPTTTTRSAGPSTSSRKHLAPALSSHLLRGTPTSRASSRRSAMLSPSFSRTGITTYRTRYCASTTARACSRTAWTACLPTAWAECNAWPKPSGTAGRTCAWAPLVTARCPRHHPIRPESPSRLRRHYRT